MSSPPGAERFRGALLGLAVADALAARGRGAVAARLAAGRWTSTTQHALCVARALLEAHGVDPRVVAAHLKHWAESGDWRNAPPALRRVLVRLRRGGPWDACAVGGLRGAAAEAVAAAVPIGAGLWDSSEARHRAARGVLRLSRRRREPAEAACVAADAVAWAVAANGSGFPPYAEMARAVRGRWLRRRLRSLERARQGSDAPAMPGLTAPPGPHPARAVLAAIEISAAGARGFMESVGVALQWKEAGVDAAALAGALVGARQGERALPEALRRGLEQEAAIARLADSLARGAVGAAGVRMAFIPAVQSAALAMGARVWRLARIAAGGSLLALGVAGLFLPFLQGILFLVSGLAILGAEFRWARDLLRRLRWILKRRLRAWRARRRPRAAARLDNLAQADPKSARRPDASRGGRD